MVFEDEARRFDVDHTHEVDPKIRHYAVERFAAGRVRTDHFDIDIDREWLPTDQLAVAMARTPAELALIVLVHCDFGRADPSPDLFLMLADKAGVLLHEALAFSSDSSVSDRRSGPE